MISLKKPKNRLTEVKENLVIDAELREEMFKAKIGLKHKALMHIKEASSKIRHFNNTIDLRKVKPAAFDQPLTTPQQVAEQKALFEKCNLDEDVKPLDKTRKTSNLRQRIMQNEESELVSRLTNRINAGTRYVDE